MNNSATTFEKGYFIVEDCNKATPIVLKLNMLDIIVAVFYFPLTLKAISIVVALFSFQKNYNLSQGFILINILNRSYNETP